MPDKPLQIMLVAGEASGDQYAAQLAQALRTRHPDWTFCGMGGLASREAGIRQIVDSTALAVVGLVEVLRYFPSIWRALRQMKSAVREQRPDLLILIDYPEFNLRLAQFAKRLGVRVLFYVSPQIWAWRAWRIRSIQRSIDHMAVIFPFEQSFYQTHDIPVTYVGHPLCGTTAPTQAAAEVRERYGLDPKRPVVGLFPGSRRSEVRQLMGVCVQAAIRLRDQARINPTAAQPQFVLAVAPGLNEQDYQPWAENTDIRFVREPIYDLMQVCDLAVAASGTVTLQLALMKVPFCMIYRMSALTYRLARWFVQMDRYSLPNIVLGENLVPEFIQEEATAERIATNLQYWLEDPAARQTMRQHLQRVRDQLGPPVGMERLADCVETLLPHYQ